MATESADPDSMLSLYRTALRLRRDLTDEPMTWLPAHDGLLAFSRGPEGDKHQAETRDKGERVK